MKYFKLRLNDPQGNLIYEKDVEVQNVFEPFIRAGVSLLVEEGTIYSGEHYSAIVIPRYGEYLQPTPILSIDPEKFREKTPWIDVCFEEPIYPEKPIRYVTIELRVKERNLVYRRDFQIMPVGKNYIKYGVVQALLGLGVMKDGESYLPIFFARDDEEAQFDRERIPKLEQQAESLIEFVSDDEESTSFPYRNPSIYTNSKVVGTPTNEDISIYINQKVMESLVREGKISGQTQVERGGILVGNVYENASGGRRIVEISDMIVSEHNASTVTELRYTFESWQAQSIKMKKEFPGKIIVGWYHTHIIDISVHSKDGKLEQTKLFFSRDDLFLHKQFFPEEWYVAMVLDPQGDSLFFQWKDKDIVACSGYYIFEDIGVAG